MIMDAIFADSVASETLDCKLLTFEMQIMANSIGFHYPIPPMPLLVGLPRR